MSESIPNVVAEPAGDVPAPPEAPRKTMLLVLIAAIGMYIMILTLNTALSLRLASVDPAGKTSSFGLAVAVSSLLLIVAVPLAGALSDRTASRFGRRRPWILGCLLISLLGAGTIGAVSSIPVIVAAYVMALVSGQVAFNAYSVIPVEGLPDDRRGRAMGLMGMCGALAMSAGSFLASALVDIPVLMMAAPVLLALVCSVPLLSLYRDPVRSRDQLPLLDPAGIARNLVVNPRRHPNFAWVWFARLLAGIAMTALLSYFVFFLMDGLKLPIAEAGRSAGLLTLISAPISVVFFTGSGWLSDKLGVRRPFVIAAALLMAIGLIIGATSSSFTQFVIAWVVFSMGQATYLTVDLALCAAVLPDARDTGKDMAVFGLALSIPNVIVPIAAPAVLAVGGSGHNYALLWFGAAALCALGSVLITFVRGVR